MSYFLYTRTRKNGRCQYVCKGQTKLFGREGLVASALDVEGKIPEGQQPPWHWHVKVPDFLQQQVFVIDLIPGGRERNEFTFYELLEVWGCSYKEGYSSALLRLRSLLSGRQDADFNDRDFTINCKNDGQPIFTFLYFRGSIRDGKLSGKWLPPGPSPTNSALLWPVDFDYFIPIIQHYTTAYKLGGEQRLPG